MVQKRASGADEAEQGKRPKGNASDQGDSQPPPIMDDDMLMRALEVRDELGWPN